MASTYGPLRVTAHGKNGPVDTKLSDVEVGQEWAYRARSHHQAARAEVMRLGTSSPLRVRIRFLDEKFEGNE